MHRLLTFTLAAGLALPALAQTAGAPPPVGFMTEMPAGATRLSGVIGTDVIGSDIRRLGTVDDVVLDRSGAIAAVVIGTGGFLGIGEKKVAVPYAALLWNYDVSPTTGPSSATTGGATLPGNQQLQTRSAVTTEPGPANPQATGTVGDPSQPAEGLRPQGATVPVTGGGEPRRAVLQMTEQELRDAPEFKGAD
jgi:sporulation protein YlmC with PRC-barrel domain